MTAAIANLRLRHPTDVLAQAETFVRELIATGRLRDGQRAAADSGPRPPLGTPGRQRPYRDGGVGQRRSPAAPAGPGHLRLPPQTRADRSGDLRGGRSPEQSGIEHSPGHPRRAATPTHRGRSPRARGDSIRAGTRRWPNRGSRSSRCRASTASAPPSPPRPRRTRFPGSAGCPIWRRSVAPTRSRAGSRRSSTR